MLLCLTMDAKLNLANYLILMESLATVDFRLLSSFTAYIATLLSVHAGFFVILGTRFSDDD